MLSTSDISAGEREFQVIETEWITLADGTRLAARVWLPKGVERAPAPAILEYLPYRRRDGTSLRDEITYPFLARNGYAGVRVDMRGNGDSDGIMEDEYTAQELNDGVEVIHWIARQEWCCGDVGMLGISWGGFNGLQIAALAPQPLKAVVTVCSTDDRYADDIHYKGGCLLNDNMTWAQQMLSYSSRPPDPGVVGEGWKEMWLARLEQMPMLAANWLRHQRRDAFWKHGSVCENPASIKAAVLAVGGWADAYSNAVFRLTENLNAPCRAIIGPWEHAYPNIARIGPRIDFLGETVKWLDCWLKPGKERRADMPKLTLFIEDSASPDTEYNPRGGCWKTINDWPSKVTHNEIFHLNADGLGATPGKRELLEISSPQDTGATAGNFCPGMRVGDELPADQRDDDEKSLVFDTPPLEREISILGAPCLNLELACDTPCAFVAARLCEVAPDGASTLISWGALNLTHTKSHEDASPIEVGKQFSAQINLNSVGRKIPCGHRLRVALSNAYWPMIWPSPEKNTVRMASGSGTMALPVIVPGASVTATEFDQPPPSAPPDRQSRRKPDSTRSATRSPDGAFVLETFDDFGSSYNPAFDLDTGSSVTQRFMIHPDDPLSARVSVEWVQTLSRGEWMIRIHTRGTMTSDATHFHLKAELESYEADGLVFRRDWNESVERDLV